ncbi:MAG: hypothetical protein ACRDPM_10545, partial [Solirubrobacteraceae bacterium]
ADLRCALALAQDEVGASPGVVTGAWTTLRPRSEDESSGDARPPRAARLGPDEQAEYTWPPRALGALAAAALTAWLTVTVPPHAPVPPAAAGLLAGAAVLLLPRLGWGALTIALAVLAASQHLPGAAVVIALALLLPLVLSPAAPTTWPLSAAAPALGLIGLAGAWPAVAARAATPWRRAALGAIGWIWLLLASAIAGKALYLPPVPGVAPPHAWMSSLSTTLHQLLGPEVSTGVLAPALVWALGAVTLPWLVRGGSFVLDVMRVVVWAAIVVSATGAAIAAVHGSVGAGGLSAPSALVGAVACAAVALAPPALAMWRDALHPGGSRARVP